MKRVSQLQRILSSESEQQIIIQVFFALCTLILIIKIADLQLIDDTYQEKAKSTTMDLQTLYPSRGLFYDRNGILLVQNEAIYNILVIYNNIDPNMDTTLFCSLLGIDERTFIENLSKDWHDIRYAKHSPFVFLKKIPADKYTKIAEFMYKFPGFYAERKSIRGYETPSAAHLLGYISEVDDVILNDSAEIYSKGDFIGTSGLEKEYEKELRGLKGVNYVLKDKWGQVVGKFDEGKLDSSAVSGTDIITSIDLSLQEYGEYLLRGRIGGIVAIEPATGEVLAMVTSPNYDPSELAVNRDRSEAFTRLLTDSLQPFFNRAISAKYPPGSTLKPLYALIGLQENVISVDEYITCNGGYYYRNSFWGCHAGSGVHNVTSAIQYSCNTYFYQLYRELVDMGGFSSPEIGLGIINEYLNALGVGVTLGIDIPNESSGLSPTAEYYNQMYSFQNAEWRSTYIISNGIGQGEVQLSTIQLANIMAFIANRGYYYTPHFAKSFEGKNKLIPPRYSEKHTIPIDKKFFEPVIQGMELAVSHGTAKQASIPGITVVGKTGTSENSHGKDHSVFVGFAPKENPQIAIAVYIENAGWGSSYGAPIGGLMMEKYINDTISAQKAYLEKRLIEDGVIP